MDLIELLDQYRSSIAHVSQVAVQAGPSRCVIYRTHCISSTMALLHPGPTVHAALLPCYLQDLLYMLYCYPVTPRTYCTCCTVTLLHPGPTVHVVLLPCYIQDLLYMLYCYPVIYRTYCTCCTVICYIQDLLYIL